MEKNIDCPYCPGRATLNKKPLKLNFRKEEFTVISHFYKCTSCEEEFTTTSLDELSMTQLYNQYREKHNIPVPEEITALRKKYNLSSAKMSDILGFGANTFSKYESGEIPTVANGNLIRIAMNPASFKSLLEASRQSLPSQERYDKLISRIDQLVPAGFDGAFSTLIPLIEKPSSLTGYKMFNPDRLKQIIIYYLRNCNPKFNDRIKLNKLLFYTDFIHYARTGYSMMGLSYRAIPFGPAPSKYDIIMTFINQDFDFSLNQKNISNGNIVELYNTTAKWDGSKFSSNEIETMEFITSQFAEISSWDIKELSHTESAWTDLSESRSIINYQKYAFEIKILS